MSKGKKSNLNTMSCLTACSPTIDPVVLASCTIVTKPGGIMFHGVMLCDADFSDVSGGSITDVATWLQLKEDGKIFVSGQVKGSKAAGSDTSTRVSSCLPETKTGSTKTINIQDFNSDEEDLTEYDFYKSIESNYSALKYFYVTCDEKVYFYENGVWAAAVDEVRDETKEQPVYIQFVATVNEIGMKKPVKVAGISILASN